MEEFDDKLGDLSQFKTLSFEEVNQGFKQYSAFANTIVDKDNSPDYRSPFHDYRNTPLGHSYLTDNPVSSIFPSTGSDEKGEKGYEYYAQVLPCETGSQVYGSYQANARKKQALFLFYEKPNPNKSNFSGDFYIAKMGDYFVQLFKRFPEPLSSSINGQSFRNITSMEDEAAYLSQLAYTFENDKINATLVRDALMREYQFYTGDRRFEEIIGNISSIPADAIGWCAEKLEDFKPTEKNYNPKAKDYSPLIPIIGAVNLNKAAQFFEDLGENPFVQGTEAAFSKVWSLVKQAASRVKDASIDHLPDAFRKLINKITGVINAIKSFLNSVMDDIGEMAKQGIEILKLANAFYCGINSGFISLIQCLLYILEFLLQPTNTFSYKQYLERRDLMEKAEDVVDWVTANVPKFLQGVKDLFKASGSISQSDMQGIFDKMKEYFGDISRYTVAFYVGIFAFELLINILLLIFTEGAGNVVKGTTYVQKAASLLKVLARETVSVATLGITDLLAFLSRFIVRFGKACAKGFAGFARFIEELLQGAKNGAKAEDLADEIHDLEEIIIKGRKLQKGGGDATKSFAENAGIKIDKWITTAKIFGQSTDYTCAATSLRMVLDDKGILLLEDELARTLKTDTNGASILDIPEVLYFKRLEDQVTAIAEEDIRLSKLLEKLEDGDKAIVSIGTEHFKGHAVVLEKVENGEVFLRDPLPMNHGASYKMNIEDFKRIFKERAVIIKK
ncbi:MULTISPECIES: cysteine peptidase family C39 domain-containing protein [Chryseobacterium]|uniref:Double-glycine peptidase n=1 Tax=Chryseobacterium camelliae TaxID=1265445 RepID=A0ABU0TJU2_9FLAO|nr:MULTISPECIES: cysteine peptidase family C39 domain-containing protein [Chryseobacterium]MDT3408823.1 putative double-glycine peptidase [Pseudacidovorax intermedius]MDQ1097319.1 putative double-glycine peptidase [Chryseobacterium camelliae]MDQ1101253.1 putative double-glycine peptidase [Chryseobacterium sp. SORGH_AS_1048]MDR6084698.1 putative double-glycine peptidase [Chryseobacterium sp. SORGH_AS_0909]MDR6132971.1 putative double-glycine peptidase [Chryseobacterium sp. SORGH_AS_1175]